MLLLAIDPGPTQSAAVLYAPDSLPPVRYSGILLNEELLGRLRVGAFGADRLAIEKVASYGMPVGAEVFETVYWSGIFAEAWGLRDKLVVRIPRLTIKTHLCHSARANDASIRQALIDRFGKPGTKKHPGPTWGLKADMWAALALAVTVADTTNWRT
jgi:hypothetical protein